MVTIQDFLNHQSFYDQSGLSDITERWTSEYIDQGVKLVITSKWRIVFPMTHT